jgi:hypothetical protein
MWSAKEARCVPVKFWEIIADSLSKAGFSLGWVSALDLQGRTIWIVDAHGYGKRFIVLLVGGIEPAGHVAPRDDKSVAGRHWKSIPQCDQILRLKDEAFWVWAAK